MTLTPDEKFQLEERIAIKIDSHIPEAEAKKQALAEWRKQQAARKEYGQ